MIKTENEREREGRPHIDSVKIELYEENFSNLKSNRPIKVEKDLNIFNSSGKLHVCHICGIGLTQRWALDMHLETHNVQIEDKIKPTLIQTTNSLDPLGAEMVKSEPKNSTENGIDAKDSTPPNGITTAYSNHDNSNERKQAGETGSCLNLPDITETWGLDFLKQEEPLHITDADEKTEIDLPNPTFTKKSRINPNASKKYRRIKQLSFITGDESVQDKAKALSSTAKMSLRSGKTLYQCSICGVGLTRRWSLKNHIRGHLGSKTFQCDVCSQNFSSKGVLDKHMKKHAGEFEYQCGECGQKFIYKTSYEYHMRVHRAEKPFECSLCHKWFSAKGNLKQHILWNHGVVEKQLECDICHMRFRTRHLLKLHIVIHYDRPRSHICSICGNGYRDIKALKNHLRVHLRTTLFYCKLCGKRLTTEENLSYHLKSHLGERKFECHHCEKKYPCKSSLQSHIKKHFNTKKFKCECGKRFDTAACLKRHSIIHTNIRPFQCKICMRTYQLKHTLTSHLKSHLLNRERPFECSECGKKFIDNARLKNHLVTHFGEKNEKCEECGKCFDRKFSLARHMKIHGDERPYECHLCDYKSLYSFGLKHHMKKHLKK